MGQVTHGKEWDSKGVWRRGKSAKEMEVSEQQEKCGYEGKGVKWWWGDDKVEYVQVRAWDATQ